MSKTEEILAKLEAVFAPVKATKKTKKNKILVINGNIGSEFVSVKEAKKIAKRLATTDAKIELYSLEGEVSVELPISIGKGE